MAHKAGTGSTRLGRDSESKRLGVKLFGEQFARKGSIIVRQRGTKYRPGENVMMGKDFTIFSIIDGNVKFTKKKVKKFNGKLEKTTFVNVESLKSAKQSGISNK